MAQFGKRGSAAPSAILVRSNAPRPATDAEIPEASVGPGWVWSSVDTIKILVALCFVAILLYQALANYSKLVIRDQRLAGTWLVANDLRAADGYCNRFFLLVTFCNAEIKVIAEPRRAPVTSSFMLFLDTGAGELLTPVRSTADPNAISIAYAVETQLKNRTLFLLGLTLFLSAIALVLIKMLVTSLQNSDGGQGEAPGGSLETHSRIGI